MRPREPQQTALPSDGARARDEVVLVGVVEEERWRSADGSFAVLRVKRESDDEILFVVGDVGGLAPGEVARFRGRYEDHASYGRRFRAVAYTPVMPTTKKGLTRFLGSGLVPGVGPAIAKKLVAKFGDRTLDVITTQSARLHEEIPGIGKKKASAIAEAVKARRADAEGLAFLHGLGLGPAMAKKVLMKYGPRTAQQLRDDPYRAAEEIPGIGFATADRIGREVGIAIDDPRRAAGAVLHVVGRAADQGHVYLPDEVLRAQTRELNVPEDLVAPAIDELASRGMLVLDEGDVYAPPMHEAEVEAARALARLVRERKPPAKMPEALAAITDLGLAEQQEEAVRRSLTSGLMVLTGGPGTGKTTTVKAIVRAHERIGHRIVLCAPTGRAAKRMSEAAGRDARTIHRLLEWNPATGSFRLCADEPINADLVLVDEASMLDVQLAASLLDAVPPESTLVLVGDVDQLPPVGAGQVLRELIASEVCPVVRLDRVFRQAQASAIVRGAHEILAGRAPTPTPTGQKGAGDLFVVRAQEPEAIQQRLVDVLRRIPAAYGLDPKRDVQVLTPMRKGPLGTEKLNELLQTELNPPRTTSSLAGVMRAGDKIMQLRNDYEREVWNGDLGWVTKVEDGVTYVEIDGRAVSYTQDDVDSIALAYASTVHKAQGSEIAAVVIVLHASHHVLLSRPLLYTALTRAKKLAVIVGDPRAIARAARTAEIAKTYCKLGARLRAWKTGASSTRSRAANDHGSS
ncbi:ATP-dependent RecD-like DNA helicase [Sandaracinus amylolyticus]|uniref:RecD-like DNA helicase YrrC n=1 Tax=Sandaracinus amylolyticus TaxID=927083 RepID=A0A0F6YJJ3_9BACT|nr:ATP-dependent RecD-like DNA helicase [Sandaracinus amylolyticus]AKF07882.1 RecD-like DNA helicase YrrC [Sandaracinus amylolyticus]